MRLDSHRARQLFATVPVARLATADAEGRPHVVVMTFAVDGDLIYTAVDQKPKITRNLRRLANIRANPRVAVLADHYEDDWDHLWWARADGRATVVDDGPGVGLLIERYPQYRRSPPEGPVIMIEVDSWSGWQAS